MFAFNKSAVIESIPGASPFFNLLIASLASQKVGFIQHSLEEKLFVVWQMHLKWERVILGNRFTGSCT